MRPHATGRCATADRHSPGRRAGRRGGHPPVSACPRGRRAGDRRRRHRLRGHAVCVPRSARLAACRRDRRHRRGGRSAPRRTGARPRLVAGRDRDRPRRAHVRGRARGPRLHLVAGTPRRGARRRTRRRGDAVARHAHPRTPGRRRARRAAGLPRGRRRRARRAGRGGRTRHGARPRLLRGVPAPLAPPRGREVRGPSHPAVSVSKPPKLILTVIDGMKPTMLQRAIAAGTAPALKAIRDRGCYVDDCCAAFPSVTPVCAGVIATGRMQAEHRVPSMNWYSREEERYVEYGSSFSASRKFGLNRQLVDTIFNMNSEHLAADVPTIFETLDDAGVRTACTSYLIFRGRHAHEVSRDWALTRVASQYFNKRSVLGPNELFYADIFASRKTGCWSRMGIPGMRDQHAGCVGSYLVEHDLFDFLLLSLPDNDAHSHRNGPHAQIASIAAADAELWRVMEAGGGAERFLDEHAMIVMADHSHSHIERVVAFTEAFADWKVLRPSGTNAGEAEIALCPAQRSAMVYLLHQSRGGALERVVATAREIEGVDLVMWLEDGRGHIAGERGELSFAPG